MLLLEFELELFAESLLLLVFELEVGLELELLILHPMANAISNANAIRQSCPEFLFMGLLQTVSAKTAPLISTWGVLVNDLASDYSWLPAPSSCCFIREQTSSAKNELDTRRRRYGRHVH